MISDTVHAVILQPQNTPTLRNNVLCKGYMASYIFERLVISIFGHDNLPIPLLEYFTEDPSHSRSTYIASRFNQHNLHDAT